MKHRKNKEAHPLAEESNKTSKIAICIFLVITTLAVYWQALDHGFINYDDDKYVTKNLHIQAGLTYESITWALTTGHFGSWAPILWLSHIIDFQFFGLDPTGHHLVNVAIHIVNTILLFLVLTRMTGALWQSGFVAALFALHPFNVESVAWVAERKNVLGAFFWFLTMWSYIRFVERPSFLKYGLTTLFLVMGLMTKAMLVTLPFVLLMLDYWPLNRWKLFKDSNNSGVKFSRLLWEKIPFFILALGSTIITFMLAKGVGALKEMETHSLSTRIANAMVSYVTYLGKTFWPSGLSVFYPHPGDSIPVWKTWFCGALLVVISLIAIKWIKKIPYFAFGWFWFLGTLVPVIQIVQAGDHAMADRYAYISLIGIFIVIAWGLTDILSRWNLNKKIPFLFVGLLTPLIIVTWVQAGHWKNSITLYEHSISVTKDRTPSFATIYNNLGNAMSNENRHEEAIMSFQHAIKINPDASYIYSNLGQVFHGLKRFDEAIEHYQQAIRIDTNYVKAHNNLAVALTEQGNLKKALHSARKCVSLDPGYIAGVVTLGDILEQSGMLSEAQFYYNRALVLDSNSADNHLYLANVLYKMGNMAEAISHFKKTIALNPRLVGAHYNLGNILGQQGHLKKAENSFKQAISLDEKLPLPHYGIGIIHLRAGQYSKAISAFERALSLNPKLEQAQLFLTEAHEKMGQN